MPTGEEPLHRQLGLTDRELQDIRRILGREPNDVELAMYSVMWSEHCSYKSSKLHLRKLPSEAPWVVVGPGENAGVVEVADDLVAVMRIESHNHPSAVEPFQGAATGVGGIIRDVLAMGARPIALGDPLRFGPLSEHHDPTASTTPAVAARNRYLFRRVVAGISYYGNAVGVPTVGGEISFAPCYSGNPLVNVFCVGLARKEDLVRARATRPGDVVVLLGAATGRDGIGGVSVLASAGFDRTSAAKRPAVQVGDPFEEKKLVEACLEIFRKRLATGVQDLGGAGLTCASSETATRGGTSIRLDVSKVHLREPGMSPAEVMVSESQERMFLAVPPENLEEVQRVAARWGIEASVVGEVTEGTDLEIRDRDRKIAKVPASSLANGPVLEREVRRPDRIEELRRSEPTSAGPVPGIEEALEYLLAVPGIGDSSWIWRQYDHQLFLNTIVGPGQDSAVLRARIPDEYCGGRRAKPDEFRTLSIAFEGGGRFSYLDPRAGARLAVAEVTRKVSCAGARTRALVDCLNFGNPEHPEVMWEFVETVEGIADICAWLGIPVVGGNVSFYNETEGSDIWPTPVLAALGVGLPASRRPPEAGFSTPGREIYLMGTATQPALDGTAYSWYLLGHLGGVPPALDVAAEAQLQAALVDAASFAFDAAENLGLPESSSLLSFHDVAEGGLAVTLAEACLLGGVGAEVTLDEALLSPIPDHRSSLPTEVLVAFSESPTRVLCAVDPAIAKAITEVFRRRGLLCSYLGSTGGKDLRIGKVALPLTKLEQIWRSSIPSVLAAG